MKRVAVTGLGVVSPIGHSVDAFWDALQEGRSGIGPIQSFAAAELSIGIAAEVKGFAPEALFERADLVLLDRFAQLGAVAAREAIRAAQLEFSGELARSSAVILGTGVGGQLALEEGYRRLFLEGRSDVHPFTVPRLMANGAVSQITREHGIRGPAFAIASACASASHAIGVAFDWVRRGAARVAITGGAEACISLGTLRGWEALRVMARDTCRPFSKQRSGMVLGEGAGAIVLEELEHARARGARVLCELAGCGMSADAGSAVQPSHEGIERALRAVLEDAGVPRQAVSYVNAHGTGTRSNDAIETRALRSVFGAHADRLAVSSTKSMHGHALGAAGALELIAAICALRHGVAPPTINYIDPDPECDLDCVPNRARPCDIEVALSSSFAFGGLNAVLAVRRID